MKGEYTSEEHKGFLRWLIGGTAKEFIQIVEMQESLLDCTFTSPIPSTEWIHHLEAKLDIVDHFPIKVKEEEAPFRTPDNIEGNLFFCWE